MKALLITLLIQSQIDGGVDAGDFGDGIPYVDVDAGVYQVVSAERPDGGGSLPAGWWLSPDRMQKVGKHIIDLSNGNDDLVHKLEEMQNPEYPKTFWGGVMFGATLTAAVMVAAYKFILEPLIK